MAGLSLLKSSRETSDRSRQPEMHCLQLERVGKLMMLHDPAVKLLFRIKTHPFMNDLS